MLFNYCWSCAVLYYLSMKCTCGAKWLVREILVRLIVASQGKADDQLNWRVTRNEKLARLREKLQRSREQLERGYQTSKETLESNIFRLMFAKLWNVQVLIKSKKLFYAIREGWDWDDVLWSQVEICNAWISPFSGTPSFIIFRIILDVISFPPLYSNITQVLFFLEFLLQLEKQRVEQLEKSYPDLISTKNLGHVNPIFPFKYEH